MSGLICRRCRQPLTPGGLAPWCLGGRYRCDTSLAIPAPVVPAPRSEQERPASDRTDADGADRTGGADRSGSLPPLRPGDEQLLAVLRRETEPLSRNRTMDRVGVGTGRADRLMVHLGWTEPAPAGAR